MGLENVVNEIISQAEKQRQEIIDQGKQEARKLIDEATSKGKEQASKFSEETRKMIDEARRMKISALSIQLHKMQLEAKKSILDEVYTHLIEKVDKMDAGKRSKMLHELVEKSRKELPDAKFVYCNSKDKELVTEIKDLKFKDTIDCLGGVMAENSAGTIRVNYTFDVLLENLREKYLNEISKRIFQN